MADTILSSNMMLPIPIVGVDPGPQYASDQNSCFTIIDAHDHSSGNGVQITPSGININSDLTFAQNSATNLKKVALTSQSVAITGTNFLSNVGGNLYFNDSSGNQIPITAGGGVAGSPGSIGSLTSPASANYTAGSKLFTWQSGVAKAAAMDNGAITIRETDVASAKGVTIQSHASLAADFSLTLPSALPGTSPQVFKSDTSGAMSFATYDQIAQGMTSVGANAIATTMTVTGADQIASTIDATGANTIAATMSSTGANSIASSMGSSGAQTIATTMSSTGANTIATNISSATSIDHALGVSNLGATSSATSITGTAISGGSFNTYASKVIAAGSRTLIYAIGTVNYLGTGEVDIRLSSPGGVITPVIRTTGISGDAVAFCLMANYLATAADTITLDAKSFMSSGTANFESSFTLTIMTLYKT